MDDKIWMRADGGLLALNLAALTLVAGAEKLSWITDLINLKILTGGLCIGLLFAILCGYFTIFGARATAAAAKVVGHPVKFDPKLTLVDQGRGAFRPVALLLLPLLLPVTTIVIVSFGTQPDRDLANTLSEAYRKCLADDIRTSKSAYLVQREGKPNLIFDADGVRASAEESCSDKYALSNTQRRVSEVNERRGGVFVNVVIIALIIFYLYLPFYKWSRLRPEDIKRTGEALKGQMRSIQTLRMGASILSMAAFMVGVGLALVNAGAAKLGAGLAETGALVATTDMPPSSTPQLQPSGRPMTININEDRGAESLGAPDPLSPVPVSQPSLTFPDHMTIDLRGAIEDANRSRTIQIEGLDRLPAGLVTNQTQLPAEIKVSGIPAPVVQVESVRVESGPKGEPGQVWRCHWKWPPWQKNNWPIYKCGLEDALKAGAKPSASVEPVASASGLK